MLNQKFEPEEITQTFRSFEAGVNAGISPLLLPPNQLAGAINTTVRGTFVHPRPALKKLTLPAAGKAMIAAAFKAGKFQGGGYFRPDNGFGSVMMAVAGQAFQLTPSGSTVTVQDRTIAGDPNPVAAPQAWFEQAEKWSIWTDGVSRPVFIDGASSRRSNYATPIPFNTTTTFLIAIPAIGATLSNNGLLTDMTNLVEGDLITFPNKGVMQVVSKDTPNPGDLVLVNINATPTGAGVATNTVVTWTHLGDELPPGRMGAYGLGRMWLSLIDGRQFVAGDQVGGASGTQANNYRDAVLHITENLFLKGGGNFAVPGSPGDIRAMKFTATMDVSLGQGPLQVFTPDRVFSCQAPSDRDTWQSVTNPILTQSVITNGGLSHNATVNVNSDILTRAIDGIRSIKLSRRDADSWGTTPVSFEVSPRLDKDDDSTLGYTSAIVFDNRYILTTKPKVTDVGIYWQSLVAMNFDPVSSLRGKAPSIYDALTWVGLNVFQLVVGQFGGVERAFALCWNETSAEFEFYELLKSASPQFNDNNGIEQRIVWSFETASVFRDNRNEKRKYKRLIDGEVHVQNMVGTVDFQFYWKPDQWSCWVPWHSWRECVKPGTLGNPGFRPTMGLGEPSAPIRDEQTGNMLFCDEANDRPLREGFTFQIMGVITGQCEIVEVNVKAVTIPDPEFAIPSCCPEPVKLEFRRQHVMTPPVVYAILDTEGRAILDVGGDAILQS